MRGNYTAYVVAAPDVHLWRDLPNFRKLRRARVLQTLAADHHAMTAGLTPTTPPRELTLAELSLLVGICLAGLLAVSYRSFGIKPVGDDYPYAHEIDRGEQEGVTALFSRSFTRQT